MLRYLIRSNKNIDRLEGDNLLVELLKLRGIENVNEYLNLSPQVLCDTNDFRGIEEAIELFHKHIINESRIHIIIDSDVDGLTSASTMWGYVSKASNIYPTYDTHDRKQHGLYKDIADAGCDEVGDVQVLRCGTGTQGVYIFVPESGGIRHLTDAAGVQHN